MKSLLAGIVCLFLISAYPAIAQFPPTLVQTVDLRQWDEIADQYHFYLDEQELIIQKSGQNHTLYTFPDVDNLGTIELEDGDQIKFVTNHSFDIDAGIEIVWSHPITYQHPYLYDYYITDLQTGENLFEFTHADGFDEFLGRISLWDSIGLNEAETCWGVSYRDAEDDLSVDLYKLNDISGEFPIWQHVEIEPGWTINSLSQFDADDDPGLEMILLHAVDGYGWSTGNAIMVYEVETQEIAWQTEEREDPFNLQIIWNYLPELPLVEVYYELLTTYEDDSKLYEVMSPPGLALTHPPYDPGIALSKPEIAGIHGFRRQPCDAN
ncbi:hypothetical protein KQI63_07725 [bacterium]|nr:hypothetical protein [bacterium]